MTRIRAFFYIVVLIVLTCGLAGAEEGGLKERVFPGYNPHDQIDDEGDIHWEKCLICHRDVPDPKKAKSMADVRIRYEEDMKMLCYRCHPEAMHPGGGWIGLTYGREAGAPYHWTVPPKSIAKNIELSEKEYKIYLPREPKTGKIFCATCHNPHERGLLIGRADWGADHLKRLRSEGNPVCQYCHRK
ncbi:MAG: cytochrome c3 family protein [Thermodesulfobacteriota bacterium]